MDNNQLAEMVSGYLEAVEWADKPENSSARFSKSQIEKAHVDCQSFVNDCGILADMAIEQPGYSAVQFGRDFWLNRCGHGVGFWDRDELKVDTPCNVTFFDRDKRTQAVNPGMELGDSLSTISYGNNLFISRFAYASLAAYRGWLYFE